MLVSAALALALFVQTPVPFPRPGQPPPATKPAAPAPAKPATARPAPPTPQAAGEPNETTLGVPLYPGSQFIASYDAGMGQRYYLFGSATDFAQVVTYYKTMLRQKGELVFEEPPVHMFDLAKFREESMAFPPSVTVKDYTWGGAAGYLNPKKGGVPERFKTIVQIVPAPPTVPR